MKNILAILQKQVKDALRNRMIILLFFIFPLVAFVFQTVVPPMEDLDPSYFSLMFATMFVGMTPANIMASIIAEEREKKTLRALIYANVKPLEYLAGIGLFVLASSFLGGVLFGLIGGYAPVQFLLFISVFVMGTLSSMLIGGVIGIFAKNQMNASGMITPIALILSFLPMLAMYNDGIKAVAQITYVYQINMLFADLSAANFTFDKFAIILANMAVFAVLFVLVYRKTDLAE